MADWHAFLGNAVTGDVYATVYSAACKQNGMDTT